MIAQTIGTSALRGGSISDIDFWAKCIILGSFQAKGLSNVIYYFIYIMTNKLANYTKVS